MKRVNRIDRLPLSVEETAAVLAISRTKAYELFASGRIPSVKIDKCRRIRRSDLAAYVANLPTATGPPPIKSYIINLDFRRHSWTLDSVHKFCEPQALVYNSSQRI